MHTTPGGSDPETSDPDRAAAELLRPADASVTVVRGGVVTDEFVRRYREFYGDPVVVEGLKGLAEDDDQGEAEPRQIDSPYLTAKEAARYLAVSYGTFRNWASQIKKTRHGRYTREALDFFANHRRK